MRKPAHPQSLCALSLTLLALSGALGLPVHADGILGTPKAPQKVVRPVKKPVKKQKPKPKPKPKSAEPALPEAAKPEPLPPLTTEGPESQFQQYVMPVGTAIPVLLQTPIDTAINQPEDTLEAAVAQDIYIGSRLVLSKHARLKGTVSRLEKPLQGMNAIIAFRFNELMLPNGEQLPIQAHVKSEKPNHIFGGELTEGTKPMRVTHRIMSIGAYNKTVMGGPRLMGGHLQFEPGAFWQAILEKPVVFVLPKHPTEDE